MPTARDAQRRLTGERGRRPAERDRALACVAFERALAGGRLPSMSGGGSMVPGTLGGMGGSGGGPMPDFGFTALEEME